MRVSAFLLFFYMKLRYNQRNSELNFRSIRMKHLTILHNNDMHGDFLPEEKDGKMVGGLPLLSGYLSKTRAEKEKPKLFP